MSLKPKLIQLVSHPIQYYVPLYEQLAADSDLDFEVWYCSKTGLETKTDVEFGVAVKWDIPLLTNYKYRFLKNYALYESLDTFMGLSNLGVVTALFKAPPKSIIWIHGWNYVTHLLAVFVGKSLGHTIVLRGDNTAVIEQKKPNTMMKKIKTFWLSTVIFRCTDAFLAVGNQNKDYYRLLNVPENKIVFAPHSIDNQRFIKFKEQNQTRIAHIRQQLGIPLSKKVIICSGKYIDKKRPLDLLKAVAQLPNRADVFIVFVGEGNLRKEMEMYINEHNMQQNVLLTGFVNQSLMPQYYLVADLYVMCSGMYETWGLSTNEAMCFGLPIILSNMVGCAYDLIEDNGFMYPSGDVQSLSKHIQFIFTQTDSNFQAMRQQSLDIINRYSYAAVISGIKSIAGFPLSVKRMKLLHIIPTYKPAYGYGGPIISIGLLCENLAALSGCDVTVAATNANIKKDLPVQDKTPVLVEGVKVYYFRRITPDHSQLSPSLLWWLWRNVRQFDVVHIHSWWNLTVMFSTLVCILRGVKPVLAPRGMLSPFTITGRFKPLYHRFIGKRLLKNTFLHATSTQEAEECLALIPNWQYATLPNFLDLATLPMPKQRHLNTPTDKSGDTIQLLFLSRLHQKKGVELLFKALSQVTFNWSLTMAGDGEREYMAQLKNLSYELGLKSKINWLGWVNAEQRLNAFAAADLLVLPSYNENFANVVIESLACGTPVLVSQYVGLSDYVSEKKLGWVCDTTVKSLQTKLTEAFYQKEKRQDIAHRSPQQIRADFDPSVLVARYLAMYEQFKLPLLKKEKEQTMPSEAFVEG